MYGVFTNGQVGYMYFFYCKISYRKKQTKNPKKIKNKNKKYHTVRAISKANRKILETGAKIDILKTYLDDRSFSWIGTVQGHQQKRRG